MDPEKKELKKLLDELGSEDELKKLVDEITEDNKHDYIDSGIVGEEKI